MASGPQNLKPCGTTAAYRRHKRNGEKPCDACRRAAVQRESERMRALRKRVPFKLSEGRGPIAPYRYRAQRYPWAIRVLAASEAKYGKPSDDEDVAA